MDVELRPVISIPPVLYKYRPFDGTHTPAIFERNEVYFQSADKLNDPFDMKLLYDFKGTQARQIRWLETGGDSNRAGSNPEKVHTWATDVVNRGTLRASLLRAYEDNDLLARKETGVFCMSAKRDNILMWAHYAKNHRGFCLGLATTNPFFGRARPVNYGRRAPRINLMDPTDRRIRAMGVALRTKAEDWRYEAEWRIVSRNTLGVQTYPPEALCEVILGCRITPSDRRRIIKWCSHRKMPPVLYEARPRKAVFGLEIIPLDY